MTTSGLHFHMRYHAMPAAASVPELILRTARDPALRGRVALATVTQRVTYTPRAEIARLLVDDVHSFPASKIKNK